MSLKYVLPVLKDASCKHGLARETTCDLLGPEIAKANLPTPNACSSCNVPKLLEDMAARDTTCAASALKKLGMWQEAKTKTTNVVCPVHQESIVTDCALAECSFYTTYPGVRSCILVYMSKHKVDSLGTLDLSMLLGIPHKTVIEDTTSALSLLRQESVDTTSKYELDPQFSLISNDFICAVCESPLAKVFTEKQGHKFCSSHCLLEKPPEVLSLEFSCGVPIKDVLGWALTKYLNRPTLEEALGLPTVVLDSLLQKYYGTELSAIYSDDVKAVSPIGLSKRVGRAPVWLTSLPRKTEGTQKAMIAKYGPVLVDLEPLHQAFDSII